MSPYHDDAIRPISAINHFGKALPFEFDKISHLKWALNISLAAYDATNQITWFHYEPNTLATLQSPGRFSLSSARKLLTEDSRVKMNRAKCGSNNRYYSPDG